MTPRLVKGQFRLQPGEEEMIDFDCIGIGALTDAIDCTATEKRNQDYLLNMEYPVGGMHWNEISVGRMILAKPNELHRIQPFTITKVARTMGGTIKVTAEHISYRLNGIVCRRICGHGLPDTLDKIMANAINNPFVLSTDLAASDIAFDTDTPKSVRAVIGDGENCLLKKYDFELEYDRFHVRFHKHRGHERPIAIRYGNNLTELSQEIDIRNLATDFYPYYRKDGIYYDLGELVSVSNPATISKAVAVDLTEFFSDGETPTHESLLSALDDYIRHNVQDVLPDSLRISFVELGKTTEYTSMVDTQFGLCDTITVAYPAFGISRKMQVVTTVYDVLRERYKSVDLGTPRVTFSDTVISLFKKRGSI